MLIKGIADKKENAEGYCRVVYSCHLYVQNLCVFFLFSLFFKYFFLCRYCYCWSGCKILLETDLINGYGCQMKCC